MSQILPGRCSRKEFLTGGIKALGAAALCASFPGTSRAQSTGDAKPYDMREFLNWAMTEFEPSIRIAGGAGRYARKPGDSTYELYGTSDMACVLYTLGKLHPNEKERSEWAEAFQNFQNPETGWLVEKATPTHVPLHNTAFALGAMQLLDLVPKYPVKMGPEYDDPRKFLATLDWKDNVYTESHKGAGAGAIFVLANLGSPKWFADYFAACDELFDPNNGMMGKGKPPSGDYDQVGGTFHYSFLYNYFNRRTPFPEKRIDAILGLQRPDGHWHETRRDWLTLDGIYLLTRTVRYCPHRVEDVNRAIRKVLDTLMREMYSPEGRKKTFAGQIPAHTLTCAVSILAEAQQHFGSDQVITEWPLKMILDRRPFI